jgi:hypothetical protein
MGIHRDRQTEGAENAFDSMHVKSEPLLHEIDESNLQMKSSLNKGFEHDEES